MTPREFLAVALMLATNYDERMMLLAEEEADVARDESGRAYWLACRDEDALRVGARRALWFEAQPCAWWAGTPKVGREEQVRYRFDPEDWEPCCEPAVNLGMCSTHASEAAAIRAALDVNG